MKNIIFALVLSLFMLSFTSCSEEDAELAGDILGNLALVAIAVEYSHRNGPDYFYRVENCSSHYQYYYGTRRIYTSCRYYGDWGNYYIRTNNYYNSINIYLPR